jgi:subtilisin-like proprotein convertase family protein
VKKIILLITIVCTISYSQVGINNTSPEAQLDIKATDKGMLIPRVSLTSLTTALPVTNPNGGAVVTSTLVYNSNTSLGVGFYYWNGSKWIRLADNSSVLAGAVASTATLVAPNPTILGALSALTNAGTNSTAASFDSSTNTRTINVTGFTGTIGNITCNVQLNHTWGSDIDLYLQSPTGQIIELCTDNGGIISTTFNVTFADAGATNITTWGGGNITGTYRPEGTLTADVIVPNITTMAGFNGVSPNGTWTLYLRDDASGDTFNFVSFSLSIATFGTANYRLIGETSMVYRSNSAIITNGTYSANVVDDGGAITAITRSTASAGAVGTTAVTLPGTVISYASDSPKQGTGNYWVNTYNQAVSNGLVDGTTYYFQLWAKANVDTPATSNEIFSLIPMLIPQ